MVFSENPERIVDLLVCSYESQRASQGCQKMNKTIVIGIGGTGLEVIRSLRRRVVENRGSLDNVPNLGFFYIDTDSRDVAVTADNKKRWEILGTSVALSPAEHYIIPAPDFGELSRNISAYPSIQDWLPLEQLKILDQTDRTAAGARQIRPLGRLGFTLAARAIETHFKDLYSHVSAPSDGGRTQIYVACSLSGGTGSGIFLDLAYRLKSWITEPRDTHAFLVFPDLQANRDPRYVPNAYAALMELNYYSLCGQTVKGGTNRIGFPLPGSREAIYDKPFEYCYVVGTRNSKDVSISLDGLAEMVAHRISLTLDSSFAQDAMALLNNGSAERAMPYTDQINGNKHSRNFFTFGLSAIEYPVDQIQEIIAWRLAGELFNSWVSPRSTPENVAQMVQNLLPKTKLTDAYLHADKDVFGGTLNFDDYQVEVRRRVEEMVSRAPDKNQVPHFTDQVKLFMEQYRDRGVVPFYQDRMHDVEGAGQHIATGVRQSINEFILNPGLGFEHASKWLEALIQYCTTHRDELTQELAGAETRKRGAPGSLDRAYHEITTAENRITFRESNVKRARQMVKVAGTIFLTAITGSQAITYALALLDGIIGELNTLAKELADWRLAVDKLSEDIAAEQQQRGTFLKMRIDGDASFNGSILFDKNVVETSYRAFDVAAALRFVMEKLDGHDDVLKLLAKADSRNTAREQVYKIVLQWMRDESRVRISEKCVADQLMEEYPESRQAERRQLLQTNRRRSAPFLPFDEMERQKHGGVETTASDQVAVMDDEQGALGNVVKVKRDLREGLGFRNENIKTIVARNHILFLAEASAFPLRLIADLKTVRERYRTYLDSSAQANSPAVPLHLRKDYSPALMDLRLAESENFHGGEEDFLAGWVEARIRMERNQTEQSDEIRYRYSQAGSTRYASLGAGWESALDRWMLDDAETESLRVRMHDENERFFRSLNTQPKKLEFAVKLSNHLDQMKERCELGEEDPVYKRWDRIRIRLMEKRQLPAPSAENLALSAAAMATGSAPAVTLAATSAAPPETVARFRKLAEVAVKASKGSLPPAFQQSLDLQRKTLGIGEAEAQQVIQGLVDQYRKPSPLDLYRQMLEQFLADGNIDDDERMFLVQMQLDNGLDPDHTDRIEAEIRQKLGKND
jgi:hypothetical protein